MPYTHLLVAVAPTPESQVLIKKAVSIARPVNAKVSLITLATDPELYNQFAAPMMENLREVMQEETREFLNELARHADYPIERMTIACGELGHHIKDFCRSHRVDLVICAITTIPSSHAPPARRKISSAAAALMSCWFPLKRANAG